MSEVYIKKSDLLKKVVTEEMGDFVEREIVHLCDINKCETYTKPVSLEGVTPKGEWIPVESEEKPEDYDRVLITVKGVRGLIVREAEYHERKNEFVVLHNHEHWEVGEKGLLAWQPLPEPYKTEKGGE